MRLWLLLRRRRRLLTLLVTSGVAFILVSSFGLPGNAGPNAMDAFDNSDYDLNYDSVDAVSRHGSSDEFRQEKNAASVPG